MDKKWLYCFTCGSSHYHTQDRDSGMWKCPNCHSYRMEQAEKIVAAVKKHTSNQQPAPTETGAEEIPPSMATAPEPAPSTGD